MKIAVTVGYWSAGPPPGAADLFAAAERAGVDQIWTAEAYGSLPRATSSGLTASVLSWPSRPGVRR
jgi:hypothetical protein